jgi:hypothetical protein
MTSTTTDEWSRWVSGSEGPLVHGDVVEGQQRLDPREDHEPQQRDRRGDK